MTKYNEILSKYLPEAAVGEVLNWIENSNVQLNISRRRTTKLGDYRAPVKVRYHKISVNHDLNKYHFLLTFVHEFAHLRTWEKYRDTVKPHGNEWKQCFRQLMEPFLNDAVFPAVLLPVLKQYLKNPSSSTSNGSLLKYLRKYDQHNNYLTLEDIPNRSVFVIHNGFTFQKLEKLRKRYKCKRLDNNRIYLVSPLMKVDLLKREFN